MTYYVSGTMLAAFYLLSLLIQQPCDVGGGFILQVREPSKLE